MKMVHRASALVVLVGISGIYHGWNLDYGEPAAQFLDSTVAAKGRGYIGAKITVKGRVTKVDTTVPKTSWIHLNGGVRCSLGKLKAMAENTNIGDTVYVDGVLKTCNEGDVLLEPAMLRDPTAPFSPKP